jgi:mono/diheme cytochrome c family protein
LPAIGDEKTEVIRSVYVELTLAVIVVRDATRYDRRVSRGVRLLVVPAVLFSAVTGAALALANLHPAKPGAPKSGSSSVVLGDAYRGETVFERSCAGCHGVGGKGGSIGPPLAGVQLSLARVKAQIDNGGGAMPPRLVTGKDEEDVLAYLATILAPAR